MSLELNLYTVYTIFAACESIYWNKKREREKEKARGQCEKNPGNDTDILLLLITIRLFHPWHSVYFNYSKNKWILSNIFFWI